MRPFRLMLGVLCLGLLAGCSAPSVPLPNFVPVPSKPSVNTAVPAPVPPRGIRIPSIEVDSSLIPVGLTAEGAIDVSHLETRQAAYYAGRDINKVGDEPLPGESGVPAAIVGHVDGPINGVKGQPGVFQRLSQLTPGAEVFVERDDGSQLKFLVDRVEKAPKSDFPTDSVYAPTDRPELRLITCGGDFDRAARHYVDNTIVFAHLA